MGQPYRVFLISVAGLFASGCAGLPAGWQCTGQNEGCAAGEVCLAGESPGTTRCYEICESSVDCASGEECRDEVCHTAATECDNSAECTSPGSCELLTGASCTPGGCVYPAKPCDTPPVDECRDSGTTFRSYAAAGTCDFVTGDCEYDLTDATCVNCDPAVGCYLIADGGGCTSDAQCESGSCADSVCCDTACDGECQACVQTPTGVADGTCANVLVGQDPRDDCTGALACTGAGACFAKGLGVGCVDGPAECWSGLCVDDVCCATACGGICERCTAGNGLCAAVANGDDPDTECAGGFGCDGNGGAGAGACIGGATDGVACGVGSQCASGECVDGVCCENACGGECVACNVSLTGAANGLCASIPFFTDPDTECLNGVGCNGDGVAPACNPPKSWGTAGLIETDNSGSALGPQVAVDPDGNAIVVWYQYAGARSDIWANRYVPGVGWGIAARIETDNAGNATGPVVAIDPSGNATVIWSQSDGTRNNIWANRYLNGFGWGTASMIETDNAGDAGAGGVAVDDSGNAIAVWSQSDGTRNNIWANRYVPTIGWGTASLIETNDLGGAVNPRVASEPSGNALAVWQHYDGSRESIWANRYVPGSGWGTAELVEIDSSESAWSPRIAVDVAGNAVVVWFTSLTTSILANRYVPGSGWGAAALIESEPGAAEYPTVVIDPAGNAMAVWAQQDGTRQSIWANRYAPGAGWGTAVLIETDNAGHADSAEVAVDPAGNATAVWYQSDGTRDNIWSNRYVPGIGWGTAALIEIDNAGDAGSAQIAADSTGNAIAVWQEWDGTRRNVWANVFR